MPAYIISYATINDPKPMERYTAEVFAVTESFGGRYLYGGMEGEVLEGDSSFDGMALIEFPSREDALRWYHSPEYAPLRALRVAACTTLLVLTADAAGDEAG
jgi:uncharacterized protein (DUF1330 family)